MTFLPLSRVLTLDAITCAGMGALLLIASGPIGELTLIPPLLLWWAGLILLPIAGFMTLVSQSDAPARWAVQMIVLGNLGWSLLSLALPVLGLISPNLLGWAFLIGQALIVAVFAGLEQRVAPKIRPRNAVRQEIVK